MNMKLMFRYLIFIVGLLFTGVGIAMTIKSNIGSTPMSVSLLVLSSVFPISFGMMNFIFSLSLVFGQIILLGKEFTRDQYLQFLVCPFFGVFIDFGLFIFRDYVPFLYFDKLIMLLAGCTILALGITMQVMAKVIINPGEGIVRAIAYKAKIKFGDAKIYFDISVLTIGVVLSIVLLGRIIGVGEGTLIIALGTGSIVKVFKWLFGHLDLERLYES